MKIACPDCGMGSENMTLHLHDCPVILGPRVPPALFAVLVRTLLVRSECSLEVRTMAEGWLSQYDAWRGVR